MSDDPLVTVYGTYLDGNGRPMTGSVTFTPDIAAPDDTPGTALKTQQMVVGRLKNDGRFEVQLTASDDSGWRTDGASIPYRVDERIYGLERQRLVFILKPGPVDLNTMPDVDPDYDGPVEVPVPGPPGPANELTIGEVETLPPGSDATATITGEPPEQVLNLGIPEGMPGADGDDLDFEAADARYVNVDGDEMVGPLTVHGHLVVEDQTDEYVSGVNTHSTSGAASAYLTGTPTPGVHGSGFSIGGQAGSSSTNAGVQVDGTAYLEATTVKLVSDSPILVRDTAGNPQLVDSANTGGSGSAVIVAPEPPDPTGLPEGTLWVDEDSDPLVQHVLIDGVWEPLVGPPGAQGPPGTAYLNAQWNFNQNTAVSPANGTMRMNATTYAGVTLLWISELDRDNLDRHLGLDLCVPGDQIIMQSAQGRAVWDVTSHADSGTYRTIGVTLAESSGSRPSAGSKTTLYFVTTGGVGGLQSRATATKTTASLAAGATESGTITLANGYRLYRISTSAPARVRLYTTTAKRDADASRPIGTDPSGDHGLVLEWVATSGLLAADLSPLVDGFDGKATPDGIIPISVTNLGTGAAALTVTLTWIRSE